MGRGASCEMEGREWIGVNEWVRVSNPHRTPSTGLSRTRQIGNPIPKPWGDGRCGPATPGTSRNTGRHSDMSEVAHDVCALVEDWKAESMLERTSSD